MQEQSDEAAVSCTEGRRFESLLLMKGKKETHF